MMRRGVGEVAGSNARWLSAPEERKDVEEAREKVEVMAYGRRAGGLKHNDNLFPWKLEPSLSPLPEGAHGYASLSG